MDVLAETVRPETFPGQCKSCESRQRGTAGNEVRKLLLETVVGDVLAIPFEQLRQSTRGCADVAFARQMAMYLAHVHFQLSLTEVGRIFNRDRTTVAHACALVEDRRDDPAIESMMELFERIVDAYEFAPFENEQG